MSFLGPESYLSKRNIRKLLRLARASPADIFFDLGCGIGQLCVVAVTEFDVKKAVGIESHKGRAKKASKRIAKLGLAGRLEIRNQDFWESDLSQATIAYCGLTESVGDVSNFESKLKPGCRLVTLALPLVGVIPKEADYPFYLMELPFTKTKRISEWVSSVLFREATVEDLYEELDSDNGYYYDKRTFKRLMTERFSL